MTNQRRPSTLIRVLRMLGPWRRWIIVNNVLVVLASTLSVVSLIAAFPLLQIVFNSGQGVEGHPDLSAPAGVELEIINVGSIDDASDAGPFQRLQDRVSVKRKELLQRLEFLAAERPIDLVYGVCLALAVAALLRLFLQIASSLCIAHVEVNFLRDLTRRLYSHCLYHDFVFLTWFPPGKLLARLSVDIQRLQTIVQLVYGTRIRQPVTIVMLTVLLFIIDFRLAMVVFLSLPLLLLPGLMIARRVRLASSKEIGLDASLLELLEEQLSGLSLIKIFGAEPRERERFDAESERIFERRRSRTILTAVSDPIQQAATVLLLAGMILLGVELVVRRGMMSGETFLFFLITLSSLYRPFKKLLTLNVALQRPLMAARAIFKTMDVQPRMVEKSDARGFPERWHTLHFDNVWFRYGKKDHWPWVLRDIDLIVPRGQLVAMLGHNGSGKTTAAMLLARLYDPVRGSVRIDDVDFRSIRQSEIRRHIGLVHQGSIIFNLSVAENIAFGLEPDEIDMSRVQVVARRVGADRWIEKLPKGFDTILGRRGEVLSGGQQQLIALCRVLYFDFPIIVYDEPYQSLDPHAMEQVANLISELRRDKTILVITHNLPLAEMADRRIVLSDGRLIADSDDIAIDQLALMDHLKQVEVGSTA